MLHFSSLEEGRIRKKDDGSFAYDYFIKDHLGNVRMVLTEEQKSDQYPAVTFEDATLVNEQLYYENVDVQRTLRPASFFTSSTNAAKVQLLRKSTSAIGAGKLLKVMAGDKIDTKVDYYIPTQTTDNSGANGLSSILSSLVNLLNAADAPTQLKGSGTPITNNLNSFSPFTTFMQPQGTGIISSSPKAYLNIVFFDEQFKFVQTGSKMYPANIMGTAQHLIKTGTDAAVAQKNGYVYIYVSNESNNMVYFDNLQVTQNKGPILEETHYYPFGLTMAGISTKAAEKIENKLKYNGIEFDNDLEVNTYEAFYRNLDPQIGRWWQVDSKADSLLGVSPYNSMVNNPINIKDPKGDIIKFDENASGEYKAKVLVAAITLLIKGVGDNLIQLASSKRTYTFNESKTLESSFLANKSGQGGVISWNPNVGLLTSNQVKLSPTTVLNHELDHAAHYDDSPKNYYDEKNSPNYFDPVYDNIEEKRVVTGSEQRTAFAMGEITGKQVTRTDHQTFGTIATQWPNSTNGTVTSISGNLDNIIIKSKKSKSKN